MLGGLGSRGKQGSERWQGPVLLLAVVVITLIAFFGYGVPRHKPQSTQNAKQAAAERHMRESMQAEWTGRCRLNDAAFIVTNGYASLHPEHVAVQTERCAGKSDGLVVNASGLECPFLIAVHKDGRASETSGAGAQASASIREGGRWAKRESAILHDLPSDSLLVDIGANVGWHTLVALSLGHRVIATEALPANAALLRHTLCLNPGLDKRLELKEAAVSDEACAVVTSDSPHGRLLCGKKVQEAGGSGAQQVVTMVLDVVLQDLEQQVDILRLDLGGHELGAVRSSAQIFETQRAGTSLRLPPAYIISEFAPRAMEDLGYNPIEYLDFFANRGYQISIANKRLEDIWTPAHGSPKAHHVVKRRQFDEFVKDIYLGSVTLEMSLKD